MSKKKKILICVAVILLSIFTLTRIEYTNRVKDTNYTAFLEEVKDGNVEKITLSSSDTFTYKDKDGAVFSAPNPKYEDFKKDMLENGIEVTESKLNSSFILSLVQISLFIIMFYLLGKQMNLFGGKGDDISKPVFPDKGITFHDVSGLTEVKKDLTAYVDYLKNPEKYNNAGAQMPRGVILYGPPGTGKTLLAKAIAGEAGVPFFSASGSDFIEKFVGTGAGRVRQLFEAARKQAPCIIFIDELDSVGASRDNGDDSEHRQTINALLAEIDGFTDNSGILVIGATNRLEDLDSALIRSGRFDSHFAVPLPATTKERLDLINMYSADKKLENIDVTSLAKEMIGFSPADIKSVINDAAILSVQSDSDAITKEYMEKALYKKTMKGHAKEDWDRNHEDMKRCAYHEAAHTIAAYFLGEDVTKVSIIPSTSGAGGATFTNPSKMGMFTKRDMENRVKICYAGRFGEKLLDSNDPDIISDGAYADIMEATKIIKSMVTECGMGGCGMLNLNVLGVDEKELFNEVISSTLENATASLTLEKKEIVLRLAEELMDKETLYAEDIRKMILSV